MALLRDLKLDAANDSDMPPRFLEYGAKTESLVKEHMQLLEQWKAYQKIAVEYTKAHEQMQATMEQFVKKNKVLKLDMDIFFNMQKEAMKQQKYVVEKYIPPFVQNLESMQSITLSKLKTLREVCRKALVERNALHAKVLAQQKQKTSATVNKLNAAIHDWKQAGTAYDLSETDYEHALDDFENDKNFTLMSIMTQNMTAQMEFYRSGYEMMLPNAEYLSGISAAVKSSSDANMDRKMHRERETMRLRTLNSTDKGIMDVKLFEKQSKSFVAPPDIARLTGEGLVLKVEKVVCMSAGTNYVPGVLFVTTFRLVFRPYDNADEKSTATAAAGTVAALPPTAAAASGGDSKSAAGNHKSDSKSASAVTTAAGVYPSNVTTSNGGRDITVALSSISHLTNIGGDRGLMSLHGKDLRVVIISFRHCVVDVSSVYASISQFVWSADNVFAFFHKSSAAATAAAPTAITPATAAGSAGTSAGTALVAVTPTAAGAAAAASVHAKWDVYDPRAEWLRIGVLPARAWRVTEINDSYRFSPSYPALLVYPASISDDDLKHCSEFRTKKRIPSLAWKLPNGSVGIFRSSQPKTSVVRSSAYDLKLLTHIGLSSAFAPPPPTPPPAAGDVKAAPPAPRSSVKPPPVPSAKSPTAAASPAAASAAAKPAFPAVRVVVDAAPVLPRNWTEHMSPDGVNKYWYNTVTSESSWYFPQPVDDVEDPEFVVPPPPEVPTGGRPASVSHERRPLPPPPTAAATTAATPKSTSGSLPPPPAPTAAASPRGAAGTPKSKGPPERPAGGGLWIPDAPPAPADLPSIPVFAAAKLRRAPSGSILLRNQPQALPSSVVYSSAPSTHRPHVHHHRKDNAADAKSRTAATAAAGAKEVTSGGSGPAATAAGESNLVELEELRGKTLVVVDCRPKIAAIGNLAKGGGWEGDSYTNCALQFLGIDNIHAVREAFRGLYSLFETLPHASPHSTAFPPLPVPLHIPSAAIPLPHPQPTLDFLAGLKASTRYVSVMKELRDPNGSNNWWRLVHAILNGTAFVVDMITNRNRSVLVHCSDGWDRTSQISALAQLCIDPYFRTFDGFCVLIEKEWCSFGHRFAQRCGHGDTRAKHKDTQRAPVFVQFIDCVYQIWQQYPNEFEFNILFLAELIDYVHSCRFGTFLFNCEAERVREKLRTRTPSVWSFVLHERIRPYYINRLFEPTVAFNKGNTKLYPADPQTKKAMTRTVYYTPLIVPTKIEQLRLFLPYYLRWDSSAPQLPSLAYTNIPK